MMITICDWVFVSLGVCLNVCVCGALGIWVSVWVTRCLSVCVSHKMFVCLECLCELQDVWVSVWVTKCLSVCVSYKMFEYLCELWDISVWVMRHLSVCESYKTFECVCVGGHWVFECLCELWNVWVSLWVTRHLSVFVSYEIVSSDFVCPCLSVCVLSHWALVITKCIILQQCRNTNKTWVIVIISRYLRDRGAQCTSSWVSIWSLISS